jgi:eukaryotic-like serine/threonine-protein kinase
MTLQPGDRIDHYTVMQKLGHGGMSEVYHAQDSQRQREVVLKFPHEDMAGDPATYERFRREIQIGELLTHPNIQKLYALQGDHLDPYLVLEYVDGVTLREVLRKEHRLPSDKAVALALQIAQALAYAHKHHVFHRDLKPENIIVTPECCAKVMDFGIAFVEGARRVTWGQMSAQVGTPDYMAPEQIKGHRGDQRTDIYALGMILYEVLAGRLPYCGDNALVVMNQHVTASPPPLSQFARQVSPALEETVMAAIRRSPDARWPSMEAFATALQHPEQVDVAALQAAREEQETSAGDGGLSEQLGLPTWQVILIVIAVIVGLITFGALVQVLHGG